MVSSKNRNYHRNHGCNLVEIADRDAETAARPNHMNAINVISPYKHHGMWVFDDTRVGLVQEPFVSGADTWIDCVVADIPNAENGFTLIFSSTPFPGHQYRLDWRRAEGGGNWYYSADLDMEGWLCPALFQYFSDAPMSLYAQVKARAWSGS